MGRFLLLTCPTKSSSLSFTQTVTSGTSCHRLLQLVLLITFLLSTQALLGSDDDQTVKFNSQILLQNPSSKLKSRLATLLELKRSIAELMKQRDRQSHSSDDVSDLEDKDIVNQKRVFCNGFTGCGGRFRGYRIHHQQSLEDMRKRVLKAATSKRPFCNTNGCFNGGKRKKNDLDNPGTSPSEFSLTSHNADVGILEPTDISKQKRLFCNGYGGCQNMGKRGLLPALMVSKQTSNDRPSSEERKPLLEILLEPNKDKRFFASSYDAAMDDFIDDLSR